MSGTRWLLILTFILVVAVGVLVLRGLLELVPIAAQTERIALTDVQGSAVEHKGDLYTLNFEQQNLVVGTISAAIPFEGEIAPLEQLEIDHIVIYPFDSRPIMIDLLGQNDRELIFLVPQWAGSSPLKETSQGKLLELLLQTYDP